MASSDADHLCWVHCNKCYELLVKKQRALLLLECHHIVCANCVQVQPAPTSQRVSKYTCPICSKVVRAQEIKNGMSQFMKQLFHTNPLSDDLPSARIISFQSKHRQHYEMHIEKQRRTLAKLEKIIGEDREKAAKKLEEFDRLHQERNRLERNVRIIMEDRRKLEEQERKRREEALHRRSPPTSLSATDDSFLNTRTAHVRPRHAQLSRGGKVSSGGRGGMAQTHHHYEKGNTEKAFEEAFRCQYTSAPAFITGASGIDQNARTTLNRASRGGIMPSRGRENIPSTRQFSQAPSVQEEIAFGHQKLPTRRSSTGSDIGLSTRTTFARLPREAIALSSGRNSMPLPRKPSPSPSIRNFPMLDSSISFML